jgi:acetylornithine deacetylase
VALAQVLAMVDERSDEIVAFASEFVRQPSINPELQPNADAERPAQEWLRGRLESSGAFDAIDYFEVKANRPNVIATRAGTGGGRSLTWLAHTDVVPVTSEQAAAWDGDDPFSGEVRDGKIWGRGSADMKGPSAAQVMAAIILRDAGVRLKGNLTIAHSCGEESGRHMYGCNAILDRGYSADLAIIPEFSNSEIYHAAKGEIYFRLTVPGKSTHICNRHLVAQPLPHGVERPGVSAIDNMLKYQLALLELERQWGLWRTDPHLPPGGMFININSIHAGAVDAEVPDSNIPDLCVATGSMLFYPHLRASEVIAEVQQTIDRVTAGDYWLREHPPTLEIPFGHPHKEAINMPVDHPGVEAIAVAMEAVTGTRASVGVAPFVCDANYWFGRGQPSLVFSCGAITGGVHGANEYYAVNDLIQSTKAFAAITMEWCGILQ